MSDDKPKSIWKKSFKGWTAFFIWLVVVAFTVLLGSFIGALVNYPKPMSSWLSGVIVVPVFCLVSCLLIIYVVWPLLHWRWKQWRRALFGFACFVTLVALFYAEEDWRGKHDWNQFKRQWEAKGEKFAFKDFIPPPVPDDQNFAFSSVWIAEIKYVFLNEPKTAEAWYGNRIYGKEVTKLLPSIPVSVSGLTGTNWWPVRFPNPPEQSGGWATAQTIDLKPWQAYYREVEKVYPAAEIPAAPQSQSPAAAVLLALSKYDSAIEELRQASRRPDSRFPLNYDDEDPSAIELPHLADLKECSQVLQLRALAELQNGQSERAFDDVKLALYLVNSIRTEPFIISQLVRFAIFQIALQPIYEGLAGHKWSDAQLAELDTQLSEFDFLAGYELSIRGERAAHVKLIGYLERKRSRLKGMFPNGLFNWFGDEDNSQQDSMNKWSIRATVYFGPKGWFYQNDLVMAHMLQQWDLRAVDDKQQTVSPEIVAGGAKFKASLKRLTPFNFLAQMLTPSLGAFTRKAAYVQNAVNLARVAIALERYRLAHGEYPESLDALVPQFMEKLPHDIIGGQPLHYRRTAGGQFVLYSVGWNETDDGGVVGLTKDGSVDINKGDWVWRYPSK